MKEVTGEPLAREYHGAVRYNKDEEYMGDDT